MDGMCQDLFTKLGPVWDVLVSECGMKVKDKSVERGLVDQVECFVLRHNKLNEVLDQALGRERWCTGLGRLAGNRPIECCLTITSSQRQQSAIIST